MIISSPDKTFIASKGENSDFLSKEKYSVYSLEGGTLPLNYLECNENDAVCKHDIPNKDLQ